MVREMEKILKEWITPCTWNGWCCEYCENKTRTNRLYVDGLKFYTTSDGNWEKCFSSELDTTPNVGKILKETF